MANEGVRCFPGMRYIDGDQGDRQSAGMVVLRGIISEG